MRTLAAVLLAVLWLAVPARAEAPASVSELVRGLGPGTAEGAPKVVGIYHELLVTEPAHVDPEARSTCARYLPAAAARVTRGGAECGVRMAAHEALAMCRWLRGDDAAATAEVGHLALVRCAEEGADGLDRALTLAERWLWAAPVEGVVARQSGARSEARRARLEKVRERREAVASAFGGGRTRPSLLVLAVGGGSPAARAGVRVGDVLVSVHARPVPSRSALETVLEGREATAVVVLRGGRRLESTWRGDADAVVVAPVPERLAGQ